MTERLAQFIRRRPGVTGLRIVALLTAVIAVGGCGGSSTLTHAQLGAKANLACSAAVASAGHLASPSESYGGLAGYARKLSPIVEKLIGNLQALNASASDRPALNNYVSALRSGDHALALLESASSAAELNQATSGLQASSIGTLASELGAPECAATPSSA